MSATTDPQLLDRGFRRCAEITREFGTTYFWGAALLPPPRRRQVHAVYALARLADDIVDLPTGGPGGPGDSGAQLAAFEDRFWTALDAGSSEDPVLAAIVHAVRGAGIPAETFERFFGAMRTDLWRTEYETWDDLLGYMDGSAAVIGEMMLPVLEPDAARARAARPGARALGLAFQLTNFLRDVDEDLDRGRVYLPQEDLRRFGADPARRVADEPWRALMRFQIARNRRLYREADEGLRLLTGTARRCVATARVLYARILDLIEDADGDVFSGRLAVPTARKAALAARMLLPGDPLRPVSRDRAALAGAPAGFVDEEPVVLLHDDGRALGPAGKAVTHHDATPLHLAFSCYIVDTEGRLLVTTRARGKLVFPGVVTNSVCGHPLPGEPLPDAVRRRARGELGVTLGEVRLVLPDFRYRAASGLVVENEICPVFVAPVDAVTVRPDPREVDDVTWMPWAEYVERARTRPGSLSPWSVEQVERLSALGPDPRVWPAADPALLPEAAR